MTNIRHYSMSTTAPDVWAGNGIIFFYYCVSYDALTDAIWK